MAYARRSQHSDVYVYLDTRGYLLCSDCNLEGAKATTTAAMLAHLELHRGAGDRVPQDCIEELESEASDNDAWIAARAGRR